VTQWSGGFWRVIQRDRWGLTSLGVQFSLLDRSLWDGRYGRQAFTMISVRRTFGPPR
jgi:hypothetical protein